MHSIERVPFELQTERIVPLVHKREGASSDTLEKGENVVLRVVGENISKLQAMRALRLAMLCLSGISIESTIRSLTIDEIQRLPSVRLFRLNGEPSAIMNMTVLRDLKLQLMTNSHL